MVDDGRGIPVDMHPVEKVPAVELVLTRLHAGGKFDDKSYAVSGGLHGVGVSRGQRAVQRARRRDPQRPAPCTASTTTTPGPAPLRKGEPTTRTGTTLTFWADRNIFETTVYNVETISRRLQEMAFLNKGLTIVLRDERNGHGEEETEPDAEGYVAKVKEKIFHYPGGLEDFVAHLNRSKDPIHKKLVVVLRRRATTTSSRSRCSGTPATPSRSTRSPTRSTPTRAAPTRRASAPR